MTNTIENDNFTYTFVFDTKALPNGEKCVPEFASSLFSEFLECFQPGHALNRACLGSDFFPWTGDIIYVDDFKDFTPKNTSTIYVPVVPLCRDYLTAPNTSESIKHLQSLDDQYKNVCLLADFSHESVIERSFYKAREFMPWFEFERYILVILGLGFSNVDFRYPWKDVVASFNFMSRITFNLMLSVADTGNFVGLEQTITNLGDKAKDKANRYLIPNRIGRYQRQKFIYDCHQEGILDDAEWSMVYPGADNEWHEGYRETFGTAPRHMSRPYHLWSSNKSEQGGPDQKIPDQLLKNSYIYVATDTFPSEKDYHGIDYHKPVDDSKPWVMHDVSEKIIKPLVYGMPPFMHNRKGTVKQLERIGFWMPGEYNNNTDIDVRIADLISNLKNFPDEIDEETWRKIRQNKRLIVDKKMHWLLTRSIFTSIEKNI